MDPIEYGLLRAPEEPPTPTAIDVALFACAALFALVVYLS